MHLAISIQICPWMGRTQRCQTSSSMSRQAAPEQSQGRYSVGHLNVPTHSWHSGGGSVPEAAVGAPGSQELHSPPGIQVFTGLAYMIPMPWSTPATASSGGEMQTEDALMVLSSASHVQNLQSWRYHGAA